MILRWHVFRPSHMVRGGVAGPYLVDALAQAKQSAPRLNWQAPPASWSDAHERALIQGLWAAIRSYGNRELIDTETTVESWPASEAVHQDRGYDLSPALPGLSNARRSFQLDASGPELRHRPY